MSTALLNSEIYRDLVGTEEMRNLFSDECSLTRWLDVEAALANACASSGVIPQSAATEIAAKAHPAHIDIQKLKERADIVGRAIAPMAAQLAEACSNDAGSYVHWGATTQDIMDTGVVLQIRDGFEIVERDLKKLIQVVGALADTHRHTLMAARTAGQQAMPTSFGLKAAGWAMELNRHLERLHEARPRILVGQFGGAVGTLAWLGDNGLDVQAQMMKELELGVPIITWHSSRDRIAEAGMLLIAISQTLGKVADEIHNLARSEISEVSEAFKPGRGSSSTMAQKRNPRFAEFVVAISRMTRAHATTLMDAMVQEHERAGGPWIPEWEAIPDIFILTGGALSQSISMLDGLQVDKTRMRTNLDANKGLLMAEAVTVALAQRVGKHKAHSLVTGACSEAREQNVELLDILIRTEEIIDKIPPNELPLLLDPANYLGETQKIIDHVLAEIDPSQ
jgi:3-carboxy-cis,cis-muconate cycloisomerase